MTGANGEEEAAVAKPAAPYIAGDQVRWVGTAGRFDTGVVVAEVRWLSGRWVCDISDPETGRVILFSAGIGELMPDPSFSRC